MRWFIALLIVVGVPVPVPAQVPAGGFQSRDDASRALANSRRQIEEIEQTYNAEQQRCQRAFAVNACMDSAKDRRDTHKREIERVELEAKDAQRRFDASERATRRAEQPTDDPIERARREAENRVRYAERQRSARVDEDQRQAREVEAPLKRARSQQRATPRSQAQVQRQSGTTLDPSARAQNVQRYEERQRSAEDHARRKEAERKENERKRAQRAAEAAHK